MILNHITETLESSQVPAILKFCKNNILVLHHNFLIDRQGADNRVIPRLDNQDRRLTGLCKALRASGFEVL